MDDTHFAPDGTVTKGQFATLIVNALKIDTDSSLASEHWAMPFVKAAQNANLIAEDIPFTVEDFDKEISREEMASMVAKAAAYKNVEFVYPKYFHKKGALSAARQGDNVNPKKESSGCQFYIVTGKVYNDSTLLGMEHQMNQARLNNAFNALGFN